MTDTLDALRALRKKIDWMDSIETNSAGDLTDWSLGESAAPLDATWVRLSSVLAEIDALLDQAEGQTETPCGCERYRAVLSTIASQGLSISSELARKALVPAPHGDVAPPGMVLRTSTAHRIIDEALRSKPRYGRGEGSE